MDAPNDFPSLLAEWQSIREDIAFLRALRVAQIATTNGPLAFQYAPGSGNVLLDLRSLTASGATPTGGLPSQTGNAGKVLGTDGATASWVGAVGDYTRVLRVATQTISNNTTTAASFDTAPQNPSGLWSAGDPTKLTMPTAGIWCFGAEWQWASNITGLRWVFIEFTRATLGNIVNSITQMPVTTGDQTHQALVSTQRMSAGDHVLLKAYQSSGGNLNTIASGLTLTAVRLGP